MPVYGASAALNRLSSSTIAVAIARRVPDDAGVWCEPQAGLALAHRRLAVLDLSPAGHQPMLSASRRYVIAFNGEIYNHLELRRELERAGLLHGSWRGHADTETLLASIEAWGLEPALQRCVGMFALALWDRRDQRLHLARDRFGEKPLYWGLSGTGPESVLLFVSELAALRAWQGFNNAIHRPALAQLPAIWHYLSTSQDLHRYSAVTAWPPGEHPGAIHGRAAPAQGLVVFSLDGGRKSF